MDLHVCLQALVEYAGNIFNVIVCHAQGYPYHSTPNKQKPQVYSHISTLIHRQLFLYTALSIAQSYATSDEVCIALYILNHFATEVQYVRSVHVQVQVLMCMYLLLVEKNNDLQTKLCSSDATSFGYSIFQHGVSNIPRCGFIYCTLPNVCSLPTLHRACTDQLSHISTHVSLI